MDPTISNGTATPPLNGAGAETPANPPPSAAPAPVLSEAQVREFFEFKARAEAQLKDLGKGLGKIRDRDRGSEQASGDPKPAPALTHEDLEGAMLLGEIRGQLPESARAEIDALRKSGLSYAQTAIIAKTIASCIAAPATGARTAGDPPVPTGAAATSAPRTSPPRPRSLSEFQALKKADPKAFAQLMADPTFDPTDLPSVI